MTKVTSIPPTVSAEAHVSVANVKPRSGGQSQNGQPVEYGHPLFVIG
jgi:biotin carboxyl carrier protein